MALDFEGTISPADRAALDAFVAEFETHDRGGKIDGRFVVPEPHPGGLRPTMDRALGIWMKDDEYAAWVDAQEGRPVTPPGKVFTADDEIPTAIVCPITDPAIFRAVAAHELIELHERGQKDSQGWIYPEQVRELHGIVLLDEYAAERTKIEIASKLGWTPSSVDSSPGLVSQTEDLRQLLPSPRANPPPDEFWLHWVNIARVWTMTAGRRDAGGAGEAAELERWAEHELIADGGWDPVGAALANIYGMHGLERDQLVELAAERVWDPIESYGRAVWVPA